MSHFTVLVIGEDPGEQLAPYQEQLEVEWYDTEPGLRDEYDNKSREMKKLPDGTLVFPWDQKYKVGELFDVTYEFPEGTEDVKVPFNEIYGSFVEFVREYEGQEDYQEGDKLGHYHNPKAKWDWYQIGGRWSGYFKLKEGAEGVVGQPGVFDNVAEKGWVDQVRKGSVDFDGMIADYTERQLKIYREFHEIVKGREVPYWAEIRDKHEDIDSAREEYRNNQVIKELNKTEQFGYWWGDYKEDLDMDEDSFVVKSMNEAISTFAIVKDGEWYEKGQMGWFGISTDEKDQTEWSNEFNEMLRTLPDDTLLTLIDCHI